MSHGDTSDPAAASPPQAYPEWPEGLGDPQLHVLDYSNAQKAATKSRKEIVAKFRATDTAPVASAALSRVSIRKPQTKDFEDALFPVVRFAR